MADHRQGASQVASDATWLIGTAYVAQIAALLLSIALRRELGPEGMGFIVLMQLVATYAPFLGLGIVQAAEREIAIDLGRGHLVSAEALERTAATVGLILGSIAVLVAFAFALLSETDATEARTLQVVGVVVLAQQVAIWATVRMRTRYRFRQFGLWSGFGTVVLIALTLAGAIAGGTMTALFGVALGSTIQALTLARTAGIRLRVRGDRTAFVRLAKLSPSFLAVGLSAVLLGSVDQLAVASLLGTSALGLYSAAYLGNLFLMRVPNLIGSVVYPRLQRDLGAHADPVRVYALSRRTTDATLVLLPPLVAGLFIGLPIVIRVLLPSFTAAIPAMRLLLVGVSGLAFAIPATQCLITINRQWRAAVATFGFAGVMWASYVIADAAGAMSITMAATVDVIAYSLYGILVQYVATRSVGRDPRWLLPATSVYLASVVSLLLAAAIAETIVPGAGAMAQALAVAIQLAIFVPAWSLSALFYRRHSPTVADDTLAVARTLLYAIRRGPRSTGPVAGP